MQSYHGLQTNGLIEFGVGVVRPEGLRFDNWKTYFEYNAHFTLPDLCCMIENVPGISADDWERCAAILHQINNEAATEPPPWGVSDMPLYDHCHLFTYKQMRLVDDSPLYAHFYRWYLLLANISPGLPLGAILSEGKSEFEPIHQGKIIRSYMDLRKAVLNYLQS